mgnify:FL=1
MTKQALCGILFKNNLYHNAVFSPQLMLSKLFFIIFTKCICIYGVNAFCFRYFYSKTVIIVLFMFLFSEKKQYT